MSSSLQSSSWRRTLSNMFCCLFVTTHGSIVIFVTVGIRQQALAVKLKKCGGLSPNAVYLNVDCCGGKNLEGRYHSSHLGIFLNKMRLHAYSPSPLHKRAIVISVCSCLLFLISFSLRPEWSYSAILQLRRRNMLFQSFQCMPGCPWIISIVDIVDVSLAVVGDTLAWYPCCRMHALLWHGF